MPDGPNAPDPAGRLERPQQVTLAGAAVILGSLALIVSAFEQISTLHTLETRNAVERLVTDQPSGFGFTVSGWLTALKVLGMVSGASAAAAAILGWQALQRSRAARAVLLALAVPLVIAGMATGPIYALLVAVGVVVLWLPAANAWFDPRRHAKMQAMSEASPPPPPSDPDGHQSAEQHQQTEPSQPPAPPPYGQPYGQPYGEPGPYGVPPSYGTPQNPYAGQDPQPQNPYAAPQAPNPYAPYSVLPVDPHARPGAVTAAAVITFILAGLATLGGLIMLIAAAATDNLYRELTDQGYELNGVTRDELRTGLAVVGLGMTLVSVAAIITAVFVMRRARSARVVLTVLAGLTIVVSLVGITAVLPLITLAGAVATIVLLYQRRSNAWFARRTGQQPPAHPSDSWPPAP